MVCVENENWLALVRATDLYNVEGFEFLKLKGVGRLSDGASGNEKVPCSTWYKNDSLEDQLFVHILNANF